MKFSTPIKVKNRKNLIGTSSAKTEKGEKENYLTGILYLAPYKIAGFNVCPNASAGCAAACLYNAGRGKFNSVQQARINKTLFFRSDQQDFLTNCIKDIQSIINKAAKKNMIPVIRLNGTSDLPFENLKINGSSLMELFPNVQFYDYTKSHKRMIKYLNGGMPSNYHLTFSASENNSLLVMDVLKQGGNVSVVFDELPKVWNGYKVINADKTDLRFTDPKNVICGLTFKGTKKEKEAAIESGFVYQS